MLKISKNSFRAFLTNHYLRRDAHTIVGSEQTKVVRQGDTASPGNLVYCTWAVLRGKDRDGKPVAVVTHRGADNRYEYIRKFKEAIDSERVSLESLELYIAHSGDHHPPHNPHGIYDTSIELANNLKDLGISGSEEFKKKIRRPRYLSWWTSTSIIKVLEDGEIILPDD